MKKFYVHNLDRGYIETEGSKEDCERWIRNVRALGFDGGMTYLVSDQRKLPNVPNSKEV